MLPTNSFEELPFSRHTGYKESQIRQGASRLVLRYSGVVFVGLSWLAEVGAKVPGGLLTVPFEDRVVVLGGPVAGLLPKGLISSQKSMSSVTSRSCGYSKKIELNYLTYDIKMCKKNKCSWIQ